jgi:hypothetical protein
MLSTTLSTLVLTFEVSYLGYITLSERVVEKGNRKGIGKLWCLPKENPCESIGKIVIQKIYQYNRRKKGTQTREQQPFALHKVQGPGLGNAAR